MAWVYILRGASERHYIGSTTNLRRRLEQHGRGHTASTKRLGGELQLVIAKELPTLQAARTLERHLKRMHKPSYAIKFLKESTGPDPS